MSQVLHAYYGARLEPRNYCMVFEMKGTAFIMTDQENLEMQTVLFNVYSGILFNYPNFQPGEPAEITYDFDCP